jgi:MFS transporter, PAT family, beta-lactamase induction signal transducer AmpG
LSLVIKLTVSTAHLNMHRKSIFQTDFNVMKDRKKDALSSPHVWTLTTYFAEGFPYTIIRIISSVFFRDMKVSLEAIGLTSLFGLPWVLKFLWGPHVDQFSTKRRWMLLMQALLVIMTVAVAFFTPVANGVRIIAIIFFIGAFIAATHDIAIDGYYMEALDDKGQAKFIGNRVMGFRIAMMTGTGVIVTIGTVINWFIGFLSAGILLLLFFMYHFFFLPVAEKQKRPASDIIKAYLTFKPLLLLLSAVLIVFVIKWIFRMKWFGIIRANLPLMDKINFSGWVAIGLLAALIILALLKKRIKGLLLKKGESFYSRAFMSFMDREKMWVFLVFIVLMRIGEWMLTSMVSPFMVDLGIKVHYGWITGGIGLPFAIIGAVLGGWMISRYTLKKVLWPLLLAQNFTNIAYMFLALALNKYIILNTGADTVAPIGGFNLFLVASVCGFDQFAGGLGNSVLITILMRSCLPEFKAAHFAIGTGLMNVSSVISGVMSGFLAGWLGYWPFFGITFLASIPGMLMVFSIPFLDEKKG